jgi:hypothetical protein
MRLLLIHGYSDSGASFLAWKARFRDYNIVVINIANYISLTNEVTIKDLAEGLDRALAAYGIPATESFDAIVHSTGMLVIRAWLTTNPARRRRLKHLIGLAPATNGSPLAHKGRSWLGAIVKGNKDLGPDFLNAGDKILDGLELASRFTWDLAHTDMFGTDVYYDNDDLTPYVFIFCGVERYGWFADLASDPGPGSDGTVRWAGVALNSRKLVLDLRTDRTNQTAVTALQGRSTAKARREDVNAFFVPGKNHGTLLREPDNAVSDFIRDALLVTNDNMYKAWLDSAKAAFPPPTEVWQQFVIRALDERGDPITDYNVQIMTGDDPNDPKSLKPFDTDVHIYGGDLSLRCFHVKLANKDKDPKKSYDFIAKPPAQLTLHLIASSGTDWVKYFGQDGDHLDQNGDETGTGVWDAKFDLTKWINDQNAGKTGDDGFKLFYPFTTTFVELYLNREPMPLSGMPRVFTII